LRRALEVGEGREAESGKKCGKEREAAGGVENSGKVKRGFTWQKDKNGNRI
jgi:hypothetical protein